MNNSKWGFALCLLGASLTVAQAQKPNDSGEITSNNHLTLTAAQEPEITGRLPKEHILDLRTKKKRKHAQPADRQSVPVIASPIFLPQSEGSGTAITASNGFLYVIVGQKLYKVNEKSLKTVQVSQLGHSVIEPVVNPVTPHRKIRTKFNGGRAVQSDKKAKRRSPVTDD